MKVQDNDDEGEGSASPPVMQGNCAWTMKWGSDFPGQAIPFGALVDFMPTPTSGTGQDVIKRKFQGATVKGILVGYALGHGNRWTKAYRVLPLRTLDGKSLSIQVRPRECSVTVQEVDEVKPVFQTGQNGRMMKGGWIFPCQGSYEKVNSTLIANAQLAAEEGEFRWDAQPGVSAVDDG